MMKYCILLAFLLVTQNAYTAALLSHENSDPGVELTIRKMLSGPVVASIHASVEAPNENLYEPSEIYLSVEDGNRSWWVHTPDHFDSMDIVQFTNSSHLLIVLSTPTSTSTATLDLDDRTLSLIGSGIGEVISFNPEDPLIRLNGQRGYSGEVFLYSSITDIKGRVIEFLAGDGNCRPVSEVVAEGADLSRLQQSMDYCVGVSQ
ncbi:MAG: hypothetical protein WD071_07005 [Pseudohongiella sp.]|uniref:hypothetical protein n=1 Tax=Pseudohongiella sp. TaxID=1979412 RepID=UPI0034A063BB